MSDTDALSIGVSIGGGTKSWMPPLLEFEIELNDDVIWCFPVNCHDLFFFTSDFGFAVGAQTIDKVLRRQKYNKNVFWAGYRAPSLFLIEDVPVHCTCNLVGAQKSEIHEFKDFI